MNNIFFKKISFFLLILFLFLFFFFFDFVPLFLKLNLWLYFCSEKHYSFLCYIFAEEILSFFQQPQVFVYILPVKILDLKFFFLFASPFYWSFMSQNAPEVDFFQLLFEWLFNNFLPQFLILSCQRLILNCVTCIQFRILFSKIFSWFF